MWTINVTQFYYEVTRPDGSKVSYTNGNDHDPGYGMPKILQNGVFKVDTKPFEGARKLVFTREDASDWFNYAYGKSAELTFCPHSFLEAFAEVPKILYFKRQADER